jgi:hypothetical protein
MEQWLKDDPSLTGSEFDRFLAERAAAVERQPSKDSAGQHNKQQPDDTSLL